MPHSTRRRGTKPPTNAAKRTTIPLSDGWSVITTKMGQVSLDSTSSASAHTPLTPAQSAPHMDTAKLLQVYEKSRRRWRETMMVSQLEGIMREAMEEGSGAESVDKAHVAGLGSLSCGGENGWRSMWQLVMFLDVITVLKGWKGAGKAEGEDEDTEREERLGGKEEEKKNRTIKMYAQDPAFNDIDEAFLAKLGIEVIRELENNKKHETSDIDIPPSATPAASAHLITPSTFFFAPCMPWALLWPQYLHNKDREPALFIGNDVAQMLEEMSGRKEIGQEREDDKGVLSAVRRFLVGEDCVDHKAGPKRSVRMERKMPEFELSQGFEGMMIYWRKREIRSQSD